jgi:glycopeptide antibiotics resistance protein
MTTSVRRVPLWVMWIPLVWCISFPWTGRTAQAQWERVHPMPFSDPADKPRDLIANLLLFIPFGYSFARGRPRARAAVGAFVAAAATSASAEALQLFSTVRFPSGTDVLAAVSGALAGCLLAAVRRKRRESCKRSETVSRPNSA